MPLYVCSRIFSRLTASKHAVLTSKFDENVSELNRQSCRPQLARCGFFASQRRRNGRIDEDRRGFDRGHCGCGFEDGAAEAFRNVPGHGLPRGLAVLVSRFPSMAVEQD